MPKSLIAQENIRVMQIVHDTIPHIETGYLNTAADAGVIKHTLTAQMMVLLPERDSIRATTTMDGSQVLICRFMTGEHSDGWLCAGVDVSGCTYIQLLGESNYKRGHTYQLRLYPLLLAITEHRKGMQLLRNRLIAGVHFNIPPEPRD